MSKTSIEMRKNPDISRRLEAAARAMCEADPLAPAPDAVIMIGMKPAKAWEARVPIFEAALKAYLGDPPSAWRAPVEATDMMKAKGDRLMMKWSEYDPEDLWRIMRDAHLNLPLKDEE